MSSTHNDFLDSDFGYLISGDTIPCRPSEEKKIAKHLLATQKDLKSPTKSNPKWVFGKAKYPRIFRKKMGNADDLTELNCGCKCEQCMINYRSYWEEKSFSRELEEALQNERTSFDTTLEDIKRMEKDFRDQISEKQLSFDVLEETHRSLKESLESERKLRADEAYRREVTNEESNNLYKEQSKLEGKLFKYDSELHSLKQQNDLLKEWGNKTNLIKDNALSQVREYTSQVDRLEKDNSDIRMRLYQLEIENSKLNMKNQNLRDRVAAIPDLRMGQQVTRGSMIKSLAPISSSSRQISRGVADTQKRGSGGGKYAHREPSTMSALSEMASTFYQQHDEY